MLGQIFSLVMCLAMVSGSSLRLPSPTVDCQKWCPRSGQQGQYDCCDQPNAQECPEFCNEIYKPVCGSDGRSYDNKCFLQVASCLNPEIIVQSQGKCRQAECPSICTAHYAPVCGSDGKTYSNACALSAASCLNPSDDIATVYDGECEPVNECPAICPAIYDPVCGSDGITYGSACALAAASCQNPKENIDIVYDGECDPTVTV